MVSVMIGKTFLGEIELTNGSTTQCNFQRFHLLPNIKVIEKLAEEFSGHIEIMPYQREGEKVKLLLSVYLESSARKGKIIAVLLREDYPENVQSLERFLERGKSRLSKLINAGSEFNEKSLNDSLLQLTRLCEKLHRSTK
jgi:hypothetical protein